MYIFLGQIHRDLTHYIVDMSTSETLLIVTGTDEVTSGISASEDHVIAWGYLFIVVLLLLVGVFGNSLVVASVIHFRFLQSITNILIATVAGMDILFVLSTVYDIGVIVSPGVWSGWLPCMIIQATACVNAVSNSFLLVGEYRHQSIALSMWNSCVIFIFNFVLLAEATLESSPNQTVKINHAEVIGWKSSCITCPL